MNIGQLARKLGLSTRTIRHYEQIGLLSPARRTSAGYRVYDEEDLVRLQQIRYLLQLDLPLKEVGRILHSAHFSPRQLLGLHLSRVEKQLEELSVLQVRLARLCRCLDAGDSPTSAELLETLEMMIMQEQKQTDPIRFEIGSGLTRYFFPSPEPEGGWPLLNGLRELRARIFQEMGVYLPGIRLVDMKDLSERGFRIKILDRVLTEGELWPERRLAQGEWPEEWGPAAAVGGPGRWVEAERVPSALARGCRVLDPLEVVLDHLQAALQKNPSQVHLVATTMPPSFPKTE